MSTSFNPINPEPGIKTPTDSPRSASSPSEELDGTVQSVYARIQESKTSSPEITDPEASSPETLSGRTSNEPQEGTFDKDILDAEGLELEPKFAAYIEIVNNGGSSKVLEKMLSLSSQEQTAFITQLKSTLKSPHRDKTFDTPLYLLIEDLNQGRFKKAIDEAIHLETPTKTIEAFITILENKGTSYLQDHIASLSEDEEASILKEMEHQHRPSAELSNSAMSEFIDQTKQKRFYKSYFEAKALPEQSAEFSAYTKIAETLFDNFKSIALSFKPEKKTAFFNFLVTENQRHPTPTIEKLIRLLTPREALLQPLKTFIENEGAFNLLNGFLGDKRTINNIQTTKIDSKTEILELSIETNNELAGGPLYRTFVNEFIQKQPTGFFINPKKLLEEAFAGYPVPCIYDTVIMRKTTKDDKITLTFEQPLHSIFIGTERGSPAIREITYHKTASNTKATLTIGKPKDENKLEWAPSLISPTLDIKL